MQPQLFDYKLYGLRLRANWPLPGLLPALGTGPGDVFLDLGQRRPSVLLPDEIGWVYAMEPGAPGGPGFRQDTVLGPEGTYLRQQYTDGRDRAEFVIDPTGSRIWVDWTDAVVLEEITALLVGSVLGSVLLLRGVTCLHASAVGIGPWAIALVGSSGAGKSTTTAGLIRMGCCPLTDDLVALEERGEDAASKTYLVQPGYPGLRLLPDATEVLCGSCDALRPIWRQSGDPPVKRYLDLLHGDATPPEYVPVLAAIYLLGPRTAVARPSILPLTGGAGLMSLLPHTHVQPSPGKTGHARRVAWLGRLTATVPVRHVSRPDGLANLTTICSAILDDVRSLAG